MRKQFLKDIFIWGIVIWFMGYILGIVLFPFVSPLFIGWIIMPIGILITIWVLLKKVTVDSLNNYIILAVIWMFIAIIFDYLFLVRVFKPVDGYYKLDVYLYYAITFILPLTIGYIKSKKKIVN
jgi:hypothetical protein